MLTLRQMPQTRLFQIVVIVAFWMAGEAVARVTGLPIPGGVIAMTVLVILLATGVLPLATVSRGATWLLGEMLVFFMPVMVALFWHREFLGWLGLKILIAVLVGTLGVMLTTSVSVDLLYRLRTRHDPR